MRFMEGMDPIRARLYPRLTKAAPFQSGYREVAKRIAERISEGRVLDIGSGPGYLAVDIAERIPGVEVIGVDITPYLVDFATRHAKERGVSDRVEFMFGNAEDLAFDDGYFDFVVSTGTLHHFPKPMVCLREVHRVLRAGGAACFLDIIWDVKSPAINAMLREKHSPIKSRLIQFGASFHSISKKEADDIFNSPELPFEERALQEYPERLSFVMEFKK